MIQPKLTRAQRLELDEYAQVRANVMAWRPPVNPHEARFEELAERIQEWFEDEPIPPS